MMTATLDDEAFEPDPTVGEILGRMRIELVELGRGADDLQGAIGAIAAKAAAALTLDDQMRLQSADALSQGLTRLLQMVCALEFDVARGLRVGSLEEAERAIDIARRRAADGDAAEGPAGKGECDFF